MHTVVETPGFLADAKSAGLADDERERIVRYLAEHPAAGDEIPGTGGARKIRFAGKGRGKSGGYRVITFFSGLAIPVFLLNVFSKGDRVDLSMMERGHLKRILSNLVEAYRVGAKRHVKGRPTRH